MTAREDLISDVGGKDRLGSRAEGKYQKALNQSLPVASSGLRLFSRGLASRCPKGERRGHLQPGYTMMSQPDEDRMLYHIVRIRQRNVPLYLEHLNHIMMVSHILYYCGQPSNNFILQEQHTYFQMQCFSNRLFFGDRIFQQSDYISPRDVSAADRHQAGEEYAMDFR